MFTDSAISTSNSQGNNRVLVRVDSNLNSTTTQTCHLETESLIVIFNPSLEFSVFDLGELIEQVVVGDSDVVEKHETIIDTIQTILGTTITNSDTR